MKFLIANFYYLISFFSCFKMYCKCDIKCIRMHKNNGTHIADELYIIIKNGKALDYCSRWKRFFCTLFNLSFYLATTLIYQTSTLARRSFHMLLNIKYRG